MGLEKVPSPITVINDAQIKHHSYVDIIGLLRSLPSWFNSMGYLFFEKGLSEKDIGTGDQIESEWTAVKDVTEYIRYSIDITIVAKDLRKVVLETGEEVYWGRVLISVTAKLTKDFQKKYEEKKILRELYERFIIKEDIKKHLGKLVVESGDLISTVKSFLK
ncbi:MAG: hypothetical protein QT08_C0021G0018 [archaeon GW2011_AR17]|nr:MAG: hypothetical protein QT08_C0021G0018 [archaeon GW2011_AR17]MBS3154546.1 hypothetical protein [Candidatus Woesearchaeota archaeon]HIH14964.1 hypothetical protein [Nanoarchaeota archaeon]HIH58386.1 hypothetical protein [Nanoarchaeota archaeon]HII14097.1 hypothetical protein [Nanoarchaeota archaeon]